MNSCHCSIEHVFKKNIKLNDYIIQFECSGQFLRIMSTVKNMHYISTIKVRTIAVIFFKFIDYAVMF